MARKSRGRQKVPMVKMANDSNLQVTFSKRRSGLFKKASELCTLCAVQAAIIVFSPGKKVFSFGHPSVETVVDHYLSRSPPPQCEGSGTMQIIEVHRSSTVCELNAQLTEVTNKLEIERKQGEELSRLRMVKQEQHWWHNPLEEMNIAHIEKLRESLEDLKKDVGQQLDKLMIQAPSNSDPFFAVGSSSVHPNMIPNVGYGRMGIVPPHPHYAWNPPYGRFI